MHTLASTRVVILLASTLVLYAYDSEYPLVVLLYYLQVVVLLRVVSILYAYSS